MAMKFSSPVIAPLQVIPVDFTCDGREISPPLVWNGLPPGTESLVVICHDPDTVQGEWVHWICYDIPAACKGLPEGVPKTDNIPLGGRQGINDFLKVGYGGPCPPSGKHTYVFELYAIDCSLDLTAGKSREEVQQAMQGHILEHAEFAAFYTRS